MSRNNHHLSYKLRKFPRCSRCDSEFILISVKYENSTAVDYEWECPKCKKNVPYNLLKEEKASKDDERLSEWCKRNCK